MKKLFERENLSKFNRIAGFYSLKNKKFNLFPRTTEDISPEDFYNYCFVPAFEKRMIIRQQLCIMDQEFKPEMPNVKVRGYND